MTIKELILKNDDFLEFKCNEHTPFPIYLVGGSLDHLDESICKLNKTDPVNGYDHIGMIGKGLLAGENLDAWYLRHAHPPRASSNELTEEYWRVLLKEHDLEVWRFKEEVSDEDRLKVIKESCQIAEFKWNEKKKLYEGIKYNWAAVILSLLSWVKIGIKALARHCAEYSFESNLIIDKVLSKEGKKDVLVTPNEIINSNLLYRIYTIKLVDGNIVIET